MRQETRGNLAAMRVAQLLGLLLFISFGLVLAGMPVRAQETPTDATPTAGAETNTVVRMEVDKPATPLASGQEFPVRVLVDNVEHMAGFEFTITFDAKKVEFSRVENQGQILVPVQGENGLFCPPPQAKDGTVVLNCNRFADPVCLGGPAGASGSGVLGTVYFKSNGKGNATLELSDSTLALDDVRPCDPDQGKAVAIAHRRGDKVSVALAGGSSGGSSMAIIIGIVVGVAAVVVIGLGGFIWFRRRQAGRPA